jgi:hypothetical protein
LLASARTMTQHFATELTRWDAVHLTLGHDLRPVNPVPSWLEDLPWGTGAHEPPELCLPLEPDPRIHGEFGVGKRIGLSPL